MATFDDLLSGKLDSIEVDVATPGDKEKTSLNEFDALLDPTTKADPATDISTTDTTPSVDTTETARANQPEDPGRLTVGRAAVQIGREYKQVLGNTLKGVLTMAQLSEMKRDMDSVIEKDRIEPYSAFLPVDWDRWGQYLNENNISTDDLQKMSEFEQHQLRKDYMLKDSDIFKRELQAGRDYLNHKFEQDPDYFTSTGYLEDFIRMGPQVTTQALVAIFSGGTVSAGMMFAMIAGGQMDQLEKENPGNFERNATASLWSALGQAILERSGMKPLTKGFKGLGSSLVKKVGKATEIFGTELWTEYAQVYPEAYADIWAKNPDKNALAKVELFLDKVIDLPFQKGALKNATIAAIWGPIMGAPGIMTAGNNGNVTDESGQKDVEVETGKPGVQVHVPDTRQETDVRKDAESVPSVETLLGVETDPTRPPPSTPAGVSVSDDLTVTDEQRTNQHQGNDSLIQVIGELAGEKAMAQHKLGIEVAQNKLDTFIPFYNDLTEAGDAQGALQMAQMMEQETNNIVNSYELLAKAATARAANKKKLPDPDQMEQIQNESIRIKEQSDKRIKAQTAIVRQQEQLARQEYIESLETVDGLQQELIGATNQATRDNQPKMAKLYNSVISEMRFRQASGHVDYFSKTPMKKLVDLEVKATLIAQENKATPNIDANVLERDNAIQRWIKQQQDDRIDYDRVQLVGERAVAEDKKEKAAEVEAKAAQAEKTKTAEAKPVVKTVERRRKGEKAQRQRKERQRIQERTGVVKKTKRAVQDQAKEVRKPIAGPTRKAELEEAKTDKTQRVEAVKRQVKEVKAHEPKSKDSKLEGELAQIEQDSIFKVLAAEVKETLRRPLKQKKSTGPQLKQDSFFKVLVSEIKETFRSGKNFGVIKGIKDSSSTWTIVTSDNPGSKTATPAANVKARRKLKLRLDTLGIPYKIGKSKFGKDTEVPFIIPSLSRKAAKKLSDELGQDSFIFAEGKKAHFIEGATVTTVDKSTIRKTTDPNEDFTELGGEKFTIPFFEEGVGKESPFVVVGLEEQSTFKKQGTLEIMDSLEKEMKLGKWKFLFDKTKKGGIKTIFVTAPGQFGKLQEVIRAYSNLKARDTAINNFEKGYKGLFLKDQNVAIINLPSLKRTAENMNEALGTVVHEHVHAAHKIAFDNMSTAEKNAFGKELKAIWEGIDPDFLRKQRDNKLVHKNIRAGINQINISINELVSYSMSHPEFAAWLDSIPASARFKAKSSKIKTMWDALVNLIVTKSLKAPSKLDEVQSLLNRHLKLSDVGFKTANTSTVRRYDMEKIAQSKGVSLRVDESPTELVVHFLSIPSALKTEGSVVVRSLVKESKRLSKPIAAVIANKELVKSIKSRGISAELSDDEATTIIRFSAVEELEAFEDAAFDFGANIDIDQITDWNSEMTDLAVNALPVTVVQTAEEATEILGVDVPGNVPGIWTEDGKLIMVADRIDSKAKWLNTWMHEQVGHQGLRNIFGENTALFNRFLDQSYTLFSVKEREALVRMAQKLGIFVGKDKQGQWILGFKKGEKRLISEEMLSERAGTMKPVTKKGILKRFKDLLTKWLPKRFMDVKAAPLLNDNDIWQIITSARENVFTGTTKFNTLLDKAVAARRPTNKFKPWKNLPDFLETDERYMDMAEESIKAAPHLKQWYAQHQDEVRENFGKDAALFNVLLAITSPQADVEINVQYAVNTYAYMMGIRDEPGGRYPNVVKERIDEKWTSPDAMLANLESAVFKVTEFARALLGDEFATVGDLWMYRLFYGDPATTVNKDVETYTKAQIVGLRQKLFTLAAQMSERTGETWTPREMQAALWVNINAKQTGKDIAKVVSYHSGLNRPTEMYGGKTPLEYLNSVVPNMSDGPLSDIVGISNIPLAPISPLAKWTAFKLGKEDKVQHTISDTEIIQPAKHGMTNFHISRMINAIAKGGREITAPDQDMATWYQKTFGFETVDDGLHMRLTDRAIDLYTDKNGRVKANNVRDNLGGFSGNYTRAVRFSRDAKNNLDDMAALNSVENDQKFLATDEDKHSHINKIHEWRDQSKLNVERMTNSLEQEFLEKYGGRKAVISRATGVSSGRLLQTAKTEMLAEAMNLYIDSGTGFKLDKVEAFHKKLMAKGVKTTLNDIRHLAVMDTMFNLSVDERAWADSNIRPHYEQFFNFAKSKGILDSHVENYVKRSWIMPKDLETAGVSWSGTGLTGFKLTPSSGKQRSFESIVDGWEAGMELRTKGILGNLNDYANEIGYTYANRRFVEYMKSLVNETGDGIIIERDSGIRPPENYTLLKDRGFATPGRVAYARKDVGDMLNKLGERSSHKFWDIPVVKFLRRMNSAIKSTLLSVSMFHHLAGIRSYVFGVSSLGWDRFRPIKAYREGLKKIDEQVGFKDPNYQHLGPIVDLLVREGLTFGRTQDWEGDTAMQESGLEEFLLKQKQGTGAGRALKGWQGLRRWKRQWTNGLFNQLFAGLKAQSGAVELTARMRKMEKKLGRGLTDAEIKTQATQVARLINADFGGLHLSRRGRNPDFQRVLQSLLLAPDWTESNWRTLTGMVPGLNAKINKAIGDNPPPPGMEKTYRHFWTSIAFRSVITVAAAQFAVLALFGDDEDREEYYKQVIGGLTDREEFAKGRWATIDITPVLDKLGLAPAGGKRVDFNMVGHFKDVFKALSPVQLIKHKQSPMIKVVESMGSRTDWKGDRFKTIGELLNDPTGLVADPKTDPRDAPGWWGGASQIVAAGLYNVFGAVPIPLSEVMATATGETSLISGAGRFVGVDVRDVRHRDPAEQLYWKKSQEIKALDRSLDEAKLVRDNRMITAARQDIKRYVKFNQTKSRLGFVRSRLSPINKKIRALEAKLELSGLIDADTAKLKSLKRRKADIFKKFAAVMER